MARKDPLGDINLLELAPVRVARWRQVEDRVVVERPKPHARFPRILLEWLSYMMAVKNLRLDEVGSFAWQLLDGKHTVGQVSVALRESFGEAVYRVRDDLAIVQTVDFFTPIADDPYEFGAISAANALSDLYAMGARPLFALSVVGFPSRRLPLRALQRILEGAVDKAREGDDCLY